jgi:phosphoglycolate phosphatase-like HAD superfamily hydrolase
MAWSSCQMVQMSVNSSCTPAGVQAAVAAEIPVIALTVGHPRAKLEKAGATHILDDWFELAELVKSTQA